MILDRIGIYLSLFKFYIQAIPVCIQQLSYLRYLICIRSIKRYFQYFDWNCSEMAFIWMNFPQISWTCQISIFVVFSMFFPIFQFIVCRVHLNFGIVYPRDNWLECLFWSVYCPFFCITRHGGLSVSLYNMLCRTWYLHINNMFIHWVQFIYKY